MLLDNRYQVISKLGEGAFGETYLAEDTRSPARRRYVVKKLKYIANTDQYQLVKDRFEREAAVLEQLSEFNNQLPKIEAYFGEGEAFYIVQEWIDGKTLKQRLQEEGKLSEQAVTKILMSVLSVLEYIHSKRIIHRDIKPENIIERAKDSECVLIDFGIIKEQANTNMTDASGSIFAGTRDYMPVCRRASECEEI